MAQAEPHEDLTDPCPPRHTHNVLSVEACVRQRRVPEAAGPLPVGAAGGDGDGGAAAVVVRHGTHGVGGLPPVAELAIGNEEHGIAGLDPTLTREAGGALPAEEDVLAVAHHR